MSFKFKKILLIRPEMMGDTILLTPIISAIKNQYPESKVYLLLKPGMEEIVKNNPKVSGWILSKDFSALLKEVKREKFDVSVVFEDNPTPQYALLCLLAGIPNRVGDKARIAYGWIYNKGVWINSSDNTLHHIELYLKFLAPLGITDIKLPLTIHTDVEAEIEVSKILPEKSTRFIGIHIGTGGGNKALLPETYAKISDMLHENIPCKVILIGGTKEYDTLQEIKTYANQPFVDLVAKLSIQNLFSVISRLDLFIGVDSGPLHAAAAFSVPTVAIFTAKDVTPCRWFPWMTRNIIIKSAKDVCNIKCSHRECKLNDCLSSIDPKKVIESANILLTGGGNKTVEETRKSALL